MRRARIALTSLALAAVAAAAPASAKGALTKAERRAVDVVSIDGASTGTAALAEIGFRGRIDYLLDTSG